MKKFLATAAAGILVLCLAGLSMAYETDFDDLRQYDRDLPGWKLGRGFVNFLSAPTELISNTTNAAIKGQYEGAYDGGLQGGIAGATNGFIAGFWPGITRTVQRGTLGILEMLTFWKPEYGPTMDPMYGTRCRAWGDQDYFDPDPFWYWGPQQ